MLSKLLRNVFVLCYSQGMSPIALVVPLPHTIHAFGKDKNGLRYAYPQQWERIRDKPTYWTINNDDTKETETNKKNQNRQGEKLL